MKFARVHRPLAAFVLASIVITLSASTTQADPTLSISVGKTAADAANNAAMTYMLTQDSSGRYVYSNSSFDNGQFNLQISISTNSPGTPSLAQLIDTNTDIRSSGDGNGDRAVRITVVDSSYTQPTNPNPNSLIMTTSFQGTDAGGVRNGTGLTSTASAGGMTLGTSSLGYNDPAQTTRFSNVITPFSLMTVTTIALNPSGGAINATSNVSIFNPAIATPEPATLGLALSGFGALSVVGLRRRASRQAA